MATALLVVDVQRDLVDALDAARRAQFLGTLKQVIAQTREAGLPVVYVRHSEDEEGGLRFGTPGWQVADEIAPLPGDSIVEKRFDDSFRETTMQQVLSGLDVDSVIICGMQTEHCVLGTLRGAEQLGYRVTLVADGHATFPFEEKGEEQIRAQMHREAAELAQIVPAASLLSNV